MTRVVGKILNEGWLCELGWYEMPSHQIGERYLGSVAGEEMNGLAKLMHWEEIGRTDGRSDDW